MFSGHQVLIDNFNVFDRLQRHNRRKDIQCATDSKNITALMCRSPRRWKDMGARNVL